VISGTRLKDDCMEATAPAGQRSRISRVLIVSPQPFYEDRGTPIAVLQVIAALSALGVEVDLLTYPVGKDVPVNNLQILRSANPLGYRAVPVGYSLRKVVLDLSMLSKLAALARPERYDVVHALEEMALPAILLCQRRDLPIVYDMQSSMPTQLLDHPVFGSRPMQAVLRRVERWMVRHANAIVCSAGLIDHVRSLDPGVRVREWLFLGQVEDKAVSAAAQRRRELGIESGARVVLYSGTFEPYQGLDTLLNAMPRILEAFPETILVLVGASDDHDMADHPVAATLLRRGCLRIVPRQPRKEIPAFLALADVLVSPRAYGDNVPLKIFDYMVAGKPIVASDIKAHRCLLGEETAVLVGQTPESLAAGVNRLLGDQEFSARLAARAIRAAGRDHEGGSFSDRIRALYLDAMEDAADGRRGSSGKDPSP
jgi:glycosyltransferase involved in cell wall biosynthesis